MARNSQQKDRKQCSKSMFHISFLLLVTWFGNKYKVLLDKGIDGFWNDMNEPASFNGPLPNDVVFYGDNQKHLHEEVHNVYGHFMSVATYEGLKKHTNKKRCF